MYMYSCVNMYKTILHQLFIVFYNRALTKLII